MNNQREKLLESLRKQLKKEGIQLNPKEVLFLSKNPEFERMPRESFVEFIDDSYYLGIGKDVYNKIREEGEKIWKGIITGQYTEGICLWGIGSGKSFLAEIISLLFVQYLLCLENPHQYFGLADDKPLAVVNMGTTATQAKNVIFAGLRKLIEESKFFQEYEPEILQTEIRFRKKNIALYCGNSQETMPIGMNIIVGVLDEAAWYLDTESRSAAENIYNTMKNRIVSRFGDKGFVFVISAPRYVDDFIAKKFEQANELSYIYSTTYKTWEVKDKMSEETFDFKVSDTETWKVPKDFEKVATMNPEKFMRDFGARPSLVLEAFDRDSAIVERAVGKERESPVIEGTTIDDWKKGQGFKEWFKGDSKPRSIHVDLALKKDACGLAMGCRYGEEETEEGKLPRVWIDLMLEIQAPPEGEIMFEDIRKVIYALRDRGFYIEKVTYDGWQSVDSIQILKEQGISAETLSVDRTLEPYDTLKSLLHTNRIDYYYFEPFIREYQRLELVKGKKVDHPAGGKKDVTDAVAGTVFSLINSQSKKGFLEYMRGLYDEVQSQEPKAPSIKELYDKQKGL